MALHLSRRKLLSTFNLHALPNSTISLFFLTSSASSSYYSTTTLKPQRNYSIADYLINSHQLSQDAASKASSNLAHLKTFDKVDLIIQYFKDYGFSTSQLDNVIKRSPRILSAKLDSTIKPKIKFLQSLGISPPDIIELLSNDPYLLSRDIDKQLGPSFLALKSILSSEADVVKVLKLCTSFLKYNLDKTLVPNIQLLKSCGIDQGQIHNCIFNFPRFFLYKPVIMKQYINKVEEMGLRKESKMFLHAVRVVSSMSPKSWKSKLKVFHSLGFSEGDILSTFRKTPHVFAASERKIMEVSNVLNSAAKHDSKFIVKHPIVLLCSIKQRIVPRLKVMDVLEESNLIEKRPSLITVLKLSRKKFFAKYVYPHSDVVGKLYTTWQRS